MIKQKWWDGSRAGVLDERHVDDAPDNLSHARLLEVVIIAHHSWLVLSFKPEKESLQFEDFHLVCREFM